MTDHYLVTDTRNEIKSVEDSALVNMPLFNRCLASLLIIMLLPLMLINSICAILKGQPIVITVNKRDALGRFAKLHYFKHGLCRESALLFSIAKGQLNFCGIHFSRSLALHKQLQIRCKYRTAPGVFNLFTLHQHSGLVVDNEEQLLVQQINASSLTCLAIVLKSLLSHALYRNQRSAAPDKYMHLFDLTINNTTIDDVVAWATTSKAVVWPNVGFFINVNSINLACDSPMFKRQLQQPVALFADGSGMRIAAKHAGYQLKDNINGTDLLPILCQRCVVKQQSIFLFGAKEGIAAQAANNLKQQHPELAIAGTHHGYVSGEETAALIQKINDSNCDVLLVALGSPIQEEWVLANRHALRCRSILAVGGLFDFYSGAISRAPISLRELGLEWIWRLIQEPKSKFYRYVVGNPLFLIRVYILGLATKGEK